MKTVLKSFLLTDKEIAVINAMRGESNSINNDTTGREKMIDRYMKMDDYDFIHQYAEAVGDDTILAVLQDTMTAHEKWDAIWYQTDEDVINDLFEAYVSFEDRRQMFLDSQDREQLCVQLVNKLHPSCNF